MRSAIRTVLVSALAIVLLAVFLRNADLARVWEHMVSARLDLLLIAIVLTAVNALIRAERWQYLLAPLGRTRFWVAFRTTVIGFAVSYVVPARVGEVLRPYLLARQERLPAPAVFAAIVVERLLDLLAVVIYLAIFLLLFRTTEATAAPALYRAVTIGAAIVTPASLTLLVGMFVMAGHPARVHTVVMGIERILPARLARVLAGLIRSFSEGLGVVRSPQRLLAATAWSMALWAGFSVQLWLLVRCLEVAMPFTGSILVNAMLVVGVAVPTPGGVGGSHEAIRLGLTSFYAADNDAAVGVAILQHGINFVPYLICGFWFLAQDGLNMTRLREMSVSARESAQQRPAEGASARQVTP